MKLEDLSPELQEKLKACKTEEELRELAEAVGSSLSDEQLESVAGGACKKDCPMDGAICRVDTNCTMKSSGCPVKDTCPDFLSCIPKYCTNLSNPTPGDPAPIQECTEFVFPNMQ